MNSNSPVNFLPEDYVERRAASRWNLICIGLCLLVLTVAFGSFFFMVRQKMVEQDIRDKVTREYDEAGKAVTDTETLAEERQRMYQKAEVTAGLLERVPRSKLLEELTKQLPKNTRILALMLKTKDAPAQAMPQTTKLEDAKMASDGKNGNAETHTPPPPPEVTIELTGLAPTDGLVAEYIAKLGKSRMLRDVTLQFSEEFHVTTDDLQRRFKLKMLINPDADFRMQSLAEAGEH